MRLIIGCNSLIGSSLSNNWKENSIKHISTTRRATILPSNNLVYFDLEHPNFDFLDRYEICTALICSSISSLRECRENNNLSRLINVDSTIRLIEYLSRSGVHVIFLSTNQVFDGTVPKRNVNDNVCPITSYGRQKCEIENLINNFDKCTVIRLSKVLDVNNKLVNSWLSNILTDKNIFPFSDMFISPISIFQVIDIINSIIDNKIYGLFQFSCNEDVSYALFAEKLVDIFQKDKSLIVPVSYKDSGLILDVESPINTSMDSSTIIDALNIYPQSILDLIRSLYFYD